MPRHLTRPLFALWFVVEGVEAVRHPAGHVATIRAAVDAATQRLGDQNRWNRWDDRDLGRVARLHGAATVTAAACLAAGRAPRTAAAVLALLTAPVAAANLVPPRTVETPAQRAQRRERLVRTASFAAGASLAATGAGPRRPCPTSPTPTPPQRG